MKNMIFWTVQFLNNEYLHSYSVNNSHDSFRENTTKHAHLQKRFLQEHQLLEYLSLTKKTNLTIKKHTCEWACETIIDVFSTTWSNKIDENKVTRYSIRNNKNKNIRFSSFSKVDAGNRVIYSDDEMVANEYLIIEVEEVSHEEMKKKNSFNKFMQEVGGWRFPKFVHELRDKELYDFQYFAIIPMKHDIFGFRTDNWWEEIMSVPDDLKRSGIKARKKYRKTRNIYAFEDKHDAIVMKLNHPSAKIYKLDTNNMEVLETSEN